MSWDSLVESLDQKVWVLSGRDIMKTMSIGSFSLPDTVKKIDAALYDESTGKALLFTDTSYYW